MGLKVTDKCIGYVQMTSVDTAAGLTYPTNVQTAGPHQPNFVKIVCEAQAIRYRDDGVAPTATVGMPLAVGTELRYDGDLRKIQVISQVAGAIVNLLFYN